MISPIFDEEWYINEVVGLIFNEVKSNKKRINEIIKKNFDDVFHRYFPNLDRILDVKSLPCYNEDMSIYDYLYLKVVKEVEKHSLNIYINDIIYGEKNYINNCYIHDDIYSFYDIYNT